MLAFLFFIIFYVAIGFLIFSLFWFILIILGIVEFPIEFSFRNKLLSFLNRRYYFNKNMYIFLKNLKKYYFAASKSYDLQLEIITKFVESLALTMTRSGETAYLISKYLKMASGESFGDMPKIILASAMLHDLIWAELIKLNEFKNIDHFEPETSTQKAFPIISEGIPLQAFA